MGEVVRKVKHSSVRIENPLLALYRGTGYFSLARTFRTVWGVVPAQVQDARQFLTARPTTFDLRRK